jgi:hypothetical protein
MAATAAIVSAVAAVGGVAASADSSRRQAHASQDAANRAAATADPAAGERTNYQDLLRQWFPQLATVDPEAIKRDPNYIFQKGEGLSAIDSAAARDGLLRSGRRDVDRTSFAEGLAGNFVRDKFTMNMGLLDRLNAMSGLTTGSPAAAGQFILGGQGMANGQTSNMWSQLGGIPAILSRQNWNAFSNGGSYNPWVVGNTGSPGTEPPPDGGWAGA